jgi:hypothetical protein
MRTKMKTKLFPLIALTLIVGAFLFAGATTAYAASDPPAEETLSVDEVWLTGDTLHIAVTDTSSGENQTLELGLSDYAKSGDEYVTVQATDSAGRKSNAIQFRNPYYVPQTAGTENTEGTSPVPDGGTSTPAPGGSTESAIPNGAKPFTPDGAGTVMDNAQSGDGKEFFTVQTPDGNVFYLIVDRQRTTDNVYLLNAVTENDLASLATPGDGKSESAIPSAPTTPPATTVTPEPTPNTTTPPATEKSGGNTGTIIFVVIAVLVVGGAGYYFKIVRPKQQGAVNDDSEDFDDEPEDGDDFDDEEIENDEGGEDE